MKEITDYGAVQIVELVIIGLNLNSGESMSKIPKIDDLKKERICPVCGYKIKASLEETKDGLLHIEVDYNKNCGECTNTALGITKDVEKMIQDLIKEGVSITAISEMK